ncbi:glutamine--fructose-6-phosphate aminotransferase [isomerizing] [Leptospira kobayashii]|uniref:Glutamine--fructose-6-phosphate aminotransferase [isomerizing] n=1 Tax=Leptospira kobayashii TaxID=1917830 RepID=A0ABN6KJK3_9LEPT|nr:glutamine--fructose-6-phosphate transaminase (isomerizing) [Leptospira kobayashii]BDA80114.1 glutamine--fructose-6-phosphate aminotransferase [isomerizing] [Leptospira kobayashii]
MCGIVGYLGKRDALPVIIKGLKRLEYRGYDSAGVAMLNGNLEIVKKKGKVSDLELEIGTRTLSATVGIGHTRWATHGEPNDKNAHPHTSTDGKLAIIHNGIIENYSAIKKELEKAGHKFNSDTDSEVLIHLIEEIKKQNNCSIDEAVRLALNEVVGAYAIVVLSKDDDRTMIAARKGSPLVVGIGEDEFFVASDATPIIEYTNNVTYLNDREMAVIKDGSLTVKNLENVTKTPFIQKLELDLEDIEKGGYPHFMLKEIFEQPKSIKDAMRGRLVSREHHLFMSGIDQYLNRFLNADRLLLIGCGTSWHAGLIGEYLFEDLARIPAEVEYASEFRYRNPVVGEKDIVIAVSQSGETADTLAAIELAKSKGALIFGVCNVVGSSIARASDAGAYLHAGPEIGVASTKAFTSQVTILTMMAMYLGLKKGTISLSQYQELLFGLDTIPDKVAKILSKADEILTISKSFYQARNFLYLGRGFNFPVALEGALKLKEISYIHAEGYPAAEMKHGPIALIDEDMPVVFIATKDASYEKVVSNIQEVKARKGRVIAIVTEGDKEIQSMADFTFEIPSIADPLVPLLAVVPLQLLSYHIAILRGCNVDQPRNLAKSVTVE